MVNSQPGTPPRGVPMCRRRGDRKSTRLNSSHSQISYAVFCLKKKKDILSRAVPVEKVKGELDSGIQKEPSMRNGNRLERGPDSRTSLSLHPSVRNPC